MENDSSPTLTAVQFDPPCGPVRGYADGSVIRATGIPYAHAERFAAPLPMPEWDEPFEATRASTPCPQWPSPFLERMLGDAEGVAAPDEDCLQLSITMPADVGVGDALPVMVWIHGGSYVWGAGDAPITDPRNLVTEQRVIVVSVTYRVGLFGFLGDGSSRPANLGLLDQHAAFRWVRRNIAAFGGEPTNVTAFGQSAGADAIAHLMIASGRERLFERAILQSPPLGLALNRRRMSAAMTLAAGTLGRDSSVQDILDAERRAAAAAARYGLKSAMPFGTQYGIAPLPAETEIDAAWSRVAPDIDVLIGNTADESEFFAGEIPIVNRLRGLPLVGQRVTRRISSAVTAAVYGRAIDRFARRHAQAGGRAFRYTLSWKVPGNPVGSGHTIDLPLLLGDRTSWAKAAIVAGADWDRVERDGAQLRALWARFARTGQLDSEGEIPDVIAWSRA
nr:Carboxylesterase family [uncultured organism]